MSTTKITKEELKTPDFFLAHAQNVVSWIVKYQTMLLGVIALVLVVGLGWIGVSYFQAHRERVATLDFYPTEKLLTKNDGTAAKPGEKEKEIAPSVFKDYETTLHEHSGTRAALVSLIAVTPELIKAGKTAQAYDWFKVVTYSPSSSDIQYGLMKMTEALLAIETQKYDEAIGIYDSLLKSDSQKAFFPEATLKSGIAFGLKKDIFHAREKFEKVRKDHPNSEASNLALQYLLYLDQKGA